MWTNESLKSRQHWGLNLKSLSCNFKFGSHCQQVLFFVCSRLSVIGDERKWARKKTKGGLKRGVAGGPVWISLMTLFWHSRSCYTIRLVNFDSTVNTPAVASYLVQKDRERGLHEWLRGIRIDFHLGRLSAGIPEYSSVKEGAATKSSKPSS